MEEASLGDEGGDRWQRAPSAALAAADRRGSRGIRFVYGDKGTTSEWLVPAAQHAQWTGALSRVAERKAADVGGGAHRGAECWLSRCAQKDRELYRDAYVVLYGDRMVVKWYYFPCGSKTLPLSALRAVGSAGGLNPLWNHKLWGMAADFAVWWAKGTIGGKKRMVADSGVWPKVGFCCDDPAELLRQLDALLQ